MLTSASARAETTCNDVVRSCDKALLDKDKVITLSDLALTQRKDQVEGLNRELQSEKDRNSAFYRQPWFLVVLGAVVGKLVLTK